MDKTNEEKNKDTGIVIVMDNGRKQPKDRYKKKSVKILSIMHVLCGVLSCIFGIFKLINSWKFIFPTAIFCGVPFLITGPELQRRFFTDFWGRPLYTDP